MYIKRRKQSLSWYECCGNTKQSIEIVKMNGMHQIVDCLLQAT